MLKDRDNKGASQKFTSIVEAIFFFLYTERNYISWYDYSAMLYDALQENDSLLPGYLIAKF